MDTFVIYRILGNDLPPRHKKSQTLCNTQFILDHELPFEGCRKEWIVNHIIDKKMEEKIINLLESRKQSFIHIPFDIQNFKRKQWPGRLELTRKFSEIKIEYLSCKDYLKLLHIINLNQARNIGLNEGKKKADWITILDGNCILTDESWKMITAKTRNTDQKYLFLNMYRLYDNNHFFNFEPSNKIVFEPQILFHRTSDQYFNEDYCWGRRSKIELLTRLGLNVEKKNYFACNVESKVGGYALRLYSGVQEGEGHPSIRGKLRKRAIKRIFFRLEGIKRLFFSSLFFNL